MSVMITGSRLIEAVRNGTFIQNGAVECAEGIKYDFRLSPRILKASFGRPVDVERLTESEKKDLCVEPGEMVFALSEERLVLPNDMMAQLSPKRKLSHAGILAIGGFCIDPLYKGHLLIGLFNFSSTPFRLMPGKKVIAATFYKLEEDEIGAFPTPETTVDDFPEELVQVMQKYKPVAMASVNDAIQRVQNDLDGLRNDIKSHSEWYQRFEGIAERHSQQIGEMVQGLNAEVRAREKGEDSITKALSGYGGQLNKIERTLAWLKGAAWVFSGIVALIVIPVLVAWLLKRFGLI